MRTMRWIKTEEGVENEAEDETDDEAESCLCLPWFILVHLVHFVPSHQETALSSRACGPVSF